MKYIFVTLFTLIPILPMQALANQNCNLSSEKDRVQREEMQGNEIITRTFLVTQYYVTVDGDQNNDFIRGPFSTQDEANTVLADCKKGNEIPIYDEDSITDGLEHSRQ